ncbi:ankyrin repeat domain-containing protein [Pseudarthrobacter sp. J75]|uniref:ankyrin repeat domain-containing protein n=1 Tax=unclassified Pseudarthrobacter TaxID=2647000 RepID=UPI002E80B47A|nr:MULTISPECIES: ankyrin repeat domain-containing protein [unclassified Pseudarthrobacter]MEE2523477.1 ankyrin repeat domain-containing protein [Pseudarthrobacter sp. J47]MEE2530452.1 ankyrin repeat domain-containing protein [Pseudarthrobacter sp. J75]MEE2570164.1 ankyrin repeat domain-containing protein [Pseudarthrobacter sp. J64]
MKRFRKAARRRLLAIVAGLAVGGLLAGCSTAAPEPAASASSSAGATAPQATTTQAPTTPVPTAAESVPPSSAAPVTPAERRAALTPEAQMDLDQQLILAAKANDPARVAELIAAGGDVNARDPIQDSAFLYAGAEGFNEVLHLTIAAGADVRSINRYGGTALIPASEHGHVETVKILIAAGVPVDHVNNLGWTAMQEAILLNNGGPNQQETVRLLLEAGANPGIRDPQGRTALDNAERLGFTEIAGLIRNR